MSEDGVTSHDKGNMNSGSEPKRSVNFKKLSRLTLEDPFTGLVNQLLLHDRLDQALMRSRRSGDRVAVFYIDLNHFQDINDEYGFEAANAVLSVVVRRLKAIIRTEDTLSRVGAKEFVAVLSIESEKALSPVTKRMQSVFDEPIEIEGISVTASAAFGIVLGSADDTAEEVLAKADEAMSVDKNEKRPPR